MSDLLNPVQPDDDLEPRRANMRVAVVVAAVVAVIAAGVSLGLAIATSSASTTEATGPSGPVTVALPPGCELLTPGQVAVLVPGTPSRIGRGPEVVLESTESACDWKNDSTDPRDPRVEPALLEVRATATGDEASARATMRISLPCKGPRSTRITVSGADEACLSHKPVSTDDGAGQAATVSARYGTLVVEVAYQRRNWPSWRVDDQTAVTAEALIGRIVQSQ